MAEKCYLCGGKTAGGICTECGMDNRKSDTRYASKINHKDCEKAPLTHVHEDKPQSFQPKIYMPGGRVGTNDKKPLFGRADLTIAVAIIIVLAVLGGIGYAGKEQSISVQTERIMEIPVPDTGEGFYFEHDPNYNPYQYTTKELALEGERWQADLPAGSYVAGLDIPEGRYRVEGGLGMDFEVDDKDSRIYLSDSMGEDAYHMADMNDIRIFDGARIFIRGGGTLSFSSENAQVGVLREPMDNPLSESYTVTGEAVAGEDFPEGTYNIITEGEEFGLVSYEIPPEDETEYGISYSLLMDKHPDSEYPEYCDRYYNAVLPKGTRIEGEGMILRLEPSTRIESEDYIQFYNNCYWK